MEILALSISFLVLCPDTFEVSSSSMMCFYHVSGYYENKQMHKEITLITKKSHKGQVEGSVGTVLSMQE